MESGQHHDASDCNEPTTTAEDATLKQGDDSIDGPNIELNPSFENKQGEILKNSQNVSYIYRQDVVTNKTNTKIGIVTEVAGDSDSDSSTSDDEDEYEDENEKYSEAVSNEEADVENDTAFDEIFSGKNDDSNSKHAALTSDQVRVLWMDESQTTESTNDVTVVDRGFLHGDYVASSSDPTGQIGIVVDVSITVDLLTHDGSAIKDKPSHELKRVRDYTVGDHVVLGSWLGRIEDVFDNVTVLFDDNSICKVMKADPLRLKPVGKNILEDGHFPYYPGQRVKASSSSVFKNARWLSGLWRANRLEGTVSKVTAGSVFVHWIASAGYGPTSATIPDEEQNPNNLTLLSCFVHSTWQVGDWCLLPSPLKKVQLKSESNDSAKDEHECNETGDDESEAEVVGNNKSLGNKSNICSSSVTASQEAIISLHRKKIRKLVVRKDKKSHRKKVEGFERAVLIVNTKTKVDVSWQDGTIVRCLDSTSLIPIDSPGDHEFIGEQYVVEKDDAVEIRRVGVVKSVDAKERTACVRWLKAVARAEDAREFDKEELVSVYELEGHPDYDYCYGDVVVRLSPVILPGKIDSGLESKQEDVENEFSDLSWVGNITGLKDGDIEVTWADGMISTVGPQAIYVVGRDDDESISAGSDANDEAASWETVEDDNMETLDNGKEDHGTNSSIDIRPEIEDTDRLPEDSGKSGPLSIPLAALGFMTRLASGIFSRGQKHSDSLNHLDIKSDRDSDDESSSQKIDNIENQFSALTTNCKEEESDIVEAAEILCNFKSPELKASPARDKLNSVFKGFDIVIDPIDHYFLGSHGQNNASRKWLRKVQQDWDIIQNNLPEGIYVRVYEDRMDLLRAVIVGAYGTPYQDGLFFFDFHLPPDYPDVPPSAYYHSGGWRINPNLYEDGKVCLSLLNTWTGKGNEVWDASTSSILQVLVSLQGLVLNSKPYFNEAGYDKQVGTAEGEKNSLSYNENTFLLNCKTMMYLIRSPPKDFEGLVIEHFKKRGYFVLKACDAYMKGHLIGTLKKDAFTSTDDNNANSNSVGFKLMLNKVVPKLFSALNEIGADCEEFKHLIQS